MTKLKKMSNKEFKQILNDSGLDTKIWGYDSILNMVVRCLYNDAKNSEERGFKLSAEHDRERANKIFDELEKRGYYG